MKKQLTIWVRNNGTAKSDTFKDRYDGEDFEIPPGGVLEVPVETATLCLGFGEEDKSRCLRRLGWAISSDRTADGITKLSKFSFHTSEKQALEYDSSKVSRSNAPPRNETDAVLSPASGVDIPQFGKKPAQANAPAG